MNLFQVCETFLLALIIFQTSHLFAKRITSLQCTGYSSGLKIIGKKFKLILTRIHICNILTFYNFKGTKL